MSRNHKQDRAAAIRWAQEILVRPHVAILDTETTGLNGSRVELLELAMIDLSGQVLFNRRFKPQEAIEAGAARVHHLTAAVLKDEPDFRTAYDELAGLFAGLDRVLIYNAEFDNRILVNTCALRGLAPLAYASECVMLWYAQFVGEYNSFYGNYRWQRLPEGDHSALGDCRSTLAILKKMAAADE